jgi:glycosyltransferase involved in cell wall biosynthesis
VSTAHGWIANDLRGKIKTLLDRTLLRRFDRVILVSHAVRQRLPRWWVADSRVQVVHNALMLDSYGRGVAPGTRQVPGPGEPIRLLAVGRLSAEKGFDLLLRAVAALAAGDSPLRLTIAGTGPEEAALRALAADLGIVEQVSYAGFVADMPDLYTRSDLVVQSSLTEGLPNVMLETAYLGVPVVATDVGGTREVIEHGVTGWLVRAGSAVELEGGVRRFLEDPAKFIAMAAQGKGRIEREFSIETRTARQTAVYEDLMGRTR